MTGVEQMFQSYQEVATIARYADGGGMYLSGQISMASNG